MNKLLQAVRGSAYYKLLSFSSRNRMWLLLGFLAILIASLADAGTIWFIQPIVNQGFLKKKDLFIQLLPLYLFLIISIRAGSECVFSYCIARVVRRIVCALREKIFQHLLNVQMNYYHSTPPGKILSLLMYHVEQMAHISSEIVVTVLRDGSFIVGLLCVMLCINWKLALIFFFIAPIIAFFVHHTGRVMRASSKKIHDTITNLSQIGHEIIDSREIVRIFNGADYEIKKFKKAVSHHSAQDLKIELAKNAGTAITQCLIACALGGILYCAIHSSIQITAGGFAAIVAAVMALIRPLKRMTDIHHLIQKGISGSEKIFQFLDQPIESHESGLTPKPLNNQIEFRDVCFSYSKKAHTLNHLSFSIEAHKTTAIVGHSGSGKSTMTNILVRFYEIDSGVILFDEIPLNALDTKLLRSQYALVTQHTTLFHDTIAQNIAYTATHIDQERLIAAAQAAEAYEFILQLPQGFNTILNDASELSGGQRQRIAIARALYKQTPILILDEATSALDSETEHKIHTQLKKTMRDRTTLIITHRLTTIEYVDHILVFDSGSVVEQGTHQDLLKQNGVYTKLYSAQSNQMESF